MRAEQFWKSRVTGDLKSWQGRHQHVLLCWSEDAEEAPDFGGEEEPQAEPQAEVAKKEVSSASLWDCGTACFFVGGNGGECLVFF